jgi:spore coat protein CotF
MTVRLSQKEKMLLEDQKTHEKVCIAKYQQYANQAQDPQLKQLFNSFAQQEEKHLNTINQILSGQVPSIAQGQQSQQGQQQSSAQSQTQTSMQGAVAAQMQAKSAAQVTTSSRNDAALCTDMLMTEKYVSGAYDSAIFEFTDANVRQVLNHIQKEEQQHGEGIYNYLQSNGMYNAQF